jgi:ribose transport system permease protein
MAPASPRHGFALIARIRPEHRSLVLGIALLLAIAVPGALLVPDFLTTNNIRSILLLASFLGLAALGQTLVALVGGLDLSIPFVIGTANIVLAALFGTNMPSLLAIVLVICGGICIGILNAILSYRLQNQALIVTLGVGFTLVGLAQIITSIGSSYSGNVVSKVPPLLVGVSAANGTTFGFGIPPVVLIWTGVTACVVFLMARTRMGREFYAVGGNRVAASRISISAFRYWVLAYAASGMMAAVTGILLLGFSGGGFVGVGDPYLFTTIAAVVLGGTSLLGGSGGYGQTVIGVLVLQMLTSLLVGIGFNYAGQQVIFGLLIIPMVAVYARSPHIKMQI